ncbi:hypothetical protein GCM10009414_19710 [Tatumella terrea]|mgnify:CR=1 FL=1|uniref:Anti-adapter protein IraP n=1 Tax=Tatumella terrea TaxID=419007 RepID=A0ABW1VWP0_9GAMM|nr:anti-adapter protein IraP [Tatumella sp. JGM118]
MKNIIAELLIKLAERDEEYKLQQERQATIEIILSALVETLSPEARLSFQTQIEHLIDNTNETSSEKSRALLNTGYLEKITGISR